MLVYSSLPPLAAQVFLGVFLAIVAASFFVPRGT
jgi:hypothetical protein